MCSECAHKIISRQLKIKKNYCPIFYRRSRNWVETEDMLKNFQVDFILKSYKKCDNKLINICNNKNRTYINSSERQFWVHKIVTLLK